MTRLTLEQSVYRDFGYADSPAAAISNRVRAYLNDRHRRILTAPGLERLRMETDTFTATVNTSTYVLAGMPIARILKIVDTTNDKTLLMRSLSWYRTVDPDPTSGSPDFWIPLGVSPAERDIGGTGLWAVRTTAGTETVHVETIATDGAMTNTTTTLNGLTRVQIGTATIHDRLIRFAVSAATEGAVELYDAVTGGNRVSRILAGRTSAQFLRIALWPTPSAADTYRVDFMHHIRDFSQDYDEPQLPLDFHYLVMVGAKIDESRKKDDTRVLQWQREWDEGLRRLLDFVANPPDYLVVPGTIPDDRSTRSNLGPWFPPGVW